MSRAETHWQMLQDIEHEAEDRAEHGAISARAQLATHVRTWQVPTNNLQAISLKNLITGLALYADQHAKRYEEGIGEDGVLGEAWSDAVYAVRDLLNGELGGLDGGTLDKMLCGMLRREGFEK